MPRRDFVRLTIGADSYGGRLMDLLGELQDETKRSDAIIEIPLTRKSLGLLQRRSLINDEMTIRDAGVETKYKIQEINRVVGKHLVRISGVSTE